MKKTALAIVAVALVLTACGDSGGGGTATAPSRSPAASPSSAASSAATTAPSQAPAPAEPVRTASSTDSAVCFNDGIVHAGSVFDHEYTVTGDGGTPPRRLLSTVTGPKEFDGQAAIELSVDYFSDGDHTQSVGTNRAYNAVRDGFVLNFGMASVDSRSTIKPPRREKIAMQPGETLEQEFVVRQEHTGGRAEESSTKLSRTYVGRESVQTALGSFQACKYTSAEQTVAGKAGKYTIEQVQWIAAEGPYRGMPLRMQTVGRYPGATIKQLMDTTRVMRYEMK